MPPPSADGSAVCTSLMADQLQAASVPIAQAAVPCISVL